MADCSRTENPDEFDYASGYECPPEGFPYMPELKMNDGRLRAMDPWDNGCSWSPDTGPAHDFRAACATHDYLADLQRFGAPGVSEPGMDHVFLVHMLDDCEERSFFARKVCTNTAGFFRAAVQEGNYATGDSIIVGP